LVVDEERTTGSVIHVSCTASTLMVGLQEGNTAHGKPVPLIPKGSVLDQVAEEN